MFWQKWLKTNLITGQQQKNEAEGSKYVREDWLCDNWIKNDKKEERFQIMSENINPILQVPYAIPIQQIE